MQARLPSHNKGCENLKNVSDHGGVAFISRPARDVGPKFSYKNSQDRRNMNHDVLDSFVFDRYPFNIFESLILPYLQISTVRNICELNTTHCECLTKRAIIRKIFDSVDFAKNPPTPNILDENLPVFNYAIPPSSFLKKLSQQRKRSELSFLKLTPSQISEMAKEGIELSKFKGLRELQIIGLRYFKIEKAMQRNLFLDNWNEDRQVKKSEGCDEFNQSELNTLFSYAENVDIRASVKEWDMAALSEFFSSARLVQFSNLPPIEFRDEGKRYVKEIFKNLPLQILSLDIGGVPPSRFIENFSNALKNVTALTLYQYKKEWQIQSNFFPLLNEFAPSLKYLRMSGMNIQATVWNKFPKFHHLQAIAIEGAIKNEMTDFTRMPQFTIRGHLTPNRGTPEHLVKVNDEGLEEFCMNSSAVTHMRLKKWPCSAWSMLTHMKNLTHLDLCSTDIRNNEFFLNLTSQFPDLRVLGVADTGSGWRPDHVNAIGEGKIALLDMRQTEAEKDISSSMLSLRNISSLAVVSIQCRFHELIKNEWRSTNPLPDLVSHSFAFHESIPGDVSRSLQN